jgi:hypothetical protein
VSAEHVLGAELAVAPYPDLPGPAIDASTPQDSCEAPTFGFKAEQPMTMSNGGTATQRWGLQRGLIAPTLEAPHGAQVEAERSLVSGEVGIAEFP